MNKQCPVGTEIQSVIFSKENFTEKSAKSWAESNDFKYGKVDEKENTFRLRQHSPSEYKKNSFRTIELTDGVKAIIACPTSSFDGGGELIINEKELRDMKARYKERRMNSLNEQLKKAQYDGDTQKIASILKQIEQTEMMANGGEIAPSRYDFRRPNFEAPVNELWIEGYKTMPTKSQVYGDLNKITSRYKEGSEYANFSPVIAVVYPYQYGWDNGYKINYSANKEVSTGFFDEINGRRKVYELTEKMAKGGGGDLLSTQIRGEKMQREIERLRKDLSDEVITMDEYIGKRNEIYGKHGKMAGGGEVRRDALFYMETGKLNDKGYPVGSINKVYRKGSGLKEIKKLKKDSNYKILDERITERGLYYISFLDESDDWNKENKVTIEFSLGDLYADGGGVGSAEIYTNFFQTKVMEDFFGDELQTFWEANKSKWDDEYVSKLRAEGFNDRDIFAILFGYRAVQELKCDSEFSLNGALRKKEGTQHEIINETIDAKNAGYYVAGLKYPQSANILIDQLFAKYKINEEPIVFDAESGQGIGDEKVYFYKGNGIYIGRTVNPEYGDKRPIDKYGVFNMGYVGIVTDSPEKLYDAIDILFNDEETYLKDLNLFYNSLGGIDARDVIDGFGEIEKITVPVVEEKVVEEVKVESTPERIVAEIEEAVSYLQGEADAGDEQAKEALEYLRDELGLSKPELSLVEESKLGDGAEILIGGKADGMSLDDIAEKHNISLDHILRQAKIGRLVEREHTSDHRKIEEIVKDHLYESPDYYTKLQKIESSFADGGGVDGLYLDVPSEHNAMFNIKSLMEIGLIVGDLQPDGKYRYTYRTERDLDKAIAILNILQNPNYGTDMPQNLNQLKNYIQVGKLLKVSYNKNRPDWVGKLKVVVLTQTNGFYLMDGVEVPNDLSKKSWIEYPKSSAIAFSPFGFTIYVIDRSGNQVKLLQYEYVTGEQEGIAKSVEKDETLLFNEAVKMNEFVDNVYGLADSVLFCKGGNLTPEMFNNNLEYNLDKESVSCFITAKNTGRMLVLRRAGSDYNGTWSLISGGVESGEATDETIKREIQEELGVNLNYDNLNLVSATKHPDRTHYYYEVTVNEEFEPTLNHENDAFMWINIGELPSDTHPLLKKYINSEVFA